MQSSDEKTEPDVILFLTSRSPVHQAAARDAAPSGCEVIMLQNPSAHEVMAHIGDASFLISERSGAVGRPVIEAGRKLRLIQRLGSLVYNIDVEAAAEAGIPVCTWPLYGCVLVAEHMLMQILMVAKRIPDAMAAIQSAHAWDVVSKRTDENTFAYNWTGRSGVSDLFEKEIGILGFGEIGIELARRLRGFNCKLWYHKRRRLPNSVENSLGISYTEPEEMYGHCDYVCSLLPYNPSTDLSIGAGAFAQMKQGAYFVNCGSGSVVDEAALADAIESRHLAGAALDTFEWEPLPLNHRLIALARDPNHNVVLTPHTAAGTDTTGRHKEYTNIIRVRAGKPPLNCVNLPIDAH